MVYMVLDDE